MKTWRFLNKNRESREKKNVIMICPVCSGFQERHIEWSSEQSGEKCPCSQHGGELGNL